MCCYGRRCPLSYIRQRQSDLCSRVSDRLPCRSNDWQQKRRCIVGKVPLTVFGCQSFLTLELLLVWPVSHWSVFSDNLVYSIQWLMMVCCLRSLRKFILARKHPGFLLSSLVRDQIEPCEHFFHRIFSILSRHHLRCILCSLSIGYSWWNDLDRNLGSLFPSTHRCDHRKFTFVRLDRLFSMVPFRCVSRTKTLHVAFVFLSASGWFLHSVPCCVCC